MSRDHATLETLDRKLAELASFLSPGEIFRALLEGTTAGAPRAAVFLLREGRWKGWSSIGYPSAASALQRQLALPAEDGWLSAVAGEEDVRWRSLAPGESAPSFGQGTMAETVGLPVRVGGRAVAVLVGERSGDEEPWSPAALAILCQSARLRLELDLAWRRLKSLAGTQGGATMTSAAPAAPAPSNAVSHAAPAVREERRPAMAPAALATPSAPAAIAEPQAAEATEIAPWSGVAAGKADTDPRREEARRYARLVATDIRLYNEEAVVVGRRERDLVRRLDEHLKRGRDAFSRRFPDLGADGARLLEDAYVQVLAGGDASLFA